MKLSPHVILSESRVMREESKDLKRNQWLRSFDYIQPFQGMDSAQDEVRGAGAWILPILIVFIMILSTPIQAQTVQEASLLATFDTEQSTIQVSGIYTVDIPDSVEELSFKALLFDDVRVLSVNFHERYVNDAGKVSFGRLASKFSRQDVIGEGIIAISEPGEKTIVIDYELSYEGNEVIDVKVPVIYINETFAEAGYMFSGDIRVPNNLFVHDGFPSGSWNRVEEDDHAIYFFSMQTIPSMVRVKASSDEPGLLSGSGWVDVLVGIVLMGLLGLAWKKTELVK